MEYLETKYGYNMDSTCDCKHGSNTYFCAISKEQIDIMKRLEKKFN